VPDNLRIDYNILNDTKTNLQELAGEIKPLLDQSLFSTLSSTESGDILGSTDVAWAVGNLHDNAKDTLGRAHDGLMQLADSFGSVGEAFLSFDAQIAQGMGITGSNLGLSNYFRDKATWDYYQAHKDQCVPGPDGKVPDFCHATNPGDTPPLDQVITTDRGSVHTHLTLDENHNVVKEESTVTYDGKTYTSVTSYSNDGHNIVTDSTYPDNSTVHNETYLNPDGSGTMYTRGSDGSWSNYTRPPKDASGNQPDWVWTDGNKNPDGSSSTTGGPSDNHPGPPGPAAGGGSRRQE
jgi:hypothetical protein